MKILYHTLTCFWMDEQYFQYDKRLYQTPTSLKNNKSLCLNSSLGKTVIENISCRSPYSNEYGIRNHTNCMLYDTWHSDLPWLTSHFRCLPVPPRTHFNPGETLIWVVSHWPTRPNILLSILATITMHSAKNIPYTVTHYTAINRVHILSHIWFSRSFEDIYLSTYRFPGSYQYFPGVFWHFINGTDTWCHLYMWM